MKKVIVEIFEKEKLKDFVINEVLGRFIGFMVGMLTARWFSYEVYERKGIKNLFGILPRKKVVVHTTPEWLQWIICALIGYITLELVNYFFRHKLYINLWEYLKKLTDKNYEEKPDTKEYVVKETIVEEPAEE